ncbi:MAG: nitrite reductase large subunit NirB [Actinomycetota bacterium]
MISTEHTSEWDEPTGDTSRVDVSHSIRDSKNTARKRLVIIGGGMVAHRLVESLTARDADAWIIDVYAEEPRAPYDRVALSSYFSGRDPEELALGDPELWRQNGVQLHRGVPVTKIDRDHHTITAHGNPVPYDHLVFATGSSAAVPPIPGTDLPGVFVYRTIDDVAALRIWVDERNHAEDRPLRGAVIGGGLLGLEAAGALRALGATTTVVEFAPRLMPLQVDDSGGQALRRLIEQLGVHVRTGTATSRLTPGHTGRVGGMDYTDAGEGGHLDADVVVIATGIRPRDELAKKCGLPIGPRGGVVVDETCRTHDPAIFAIGEVACFEGRTLGLVAPGYAMAEVVADRLLGGAATFTAPDLSTKLKLLGVDVASFGDAFASAEGSLEVVYADPVAGVYSKLVLSDDAKHLRGGILVGDASAYSTLSALVGTKLDGDPAAWLLPGGMTPPSGDLPDAATVCTCNAVTAGQIRCAVDDGGCTDVTGVKACTRAGTSCGSCLPVVKTLVTQRLAAAGIEISQALCEHFSMSRAELFDVIRVREIRSFTEVITTFGQGRGCDICKPVVASILASLGHGHVLDGENAALQDTNDHVMANLQKDGTYSVVPRIPGGEVTPEGLMVIGEVARDFGLYTKITGGQRIDMFGARIEQLPKIWRRLVDAGFESGHAYGKSLRTVKSCVGQTWCRFGVQDSTALAVALELRYRGLRAPHKLKLGVSGCARECAEARGKDVGVIATEKGWNLYVGGNGGHTPRHAQLLVEDVDSDRLVQLVDRFLMYYVRTADRLQRTAPWIESIEGGLDHVRDVVVNDSLGLGADLDAAMERHVNTYSDEWRDTLEDPAKLARFASFINAPLTPDPTLAYVAERGQPRPATAEERRAGVFVSGPRLEVRS